MLKKKKTIRRKISSAKKECFFCKEKKSPHFADAATLQKFLSDRGKILSRLRSGICSMHQRALTTHIKYARHLALLPFLSRD